MPPRGRPSQVQRRSEELVSTFIDLIAVRGLEATTLNDVAEAAGISRTAIRHFIGNRNNLIAAAVSSLTANYARTISDKVGENPNPRALVKLLFSPTWTADGTTVPRAFDVLLIEASQNAELSLLFRNAYQGLIDLIVTSLRSHCQTAQTNRELQAIAYVILCLSEHNATMQAIGFEKQTRSAGYRHSIGLVDSVTKKSL